MHVIPSTYTRNAMPWLKGRRRFLTHIAAVCSLVSNQVQFSLIDQRPLAKMAPYCEKEGVKILAVSRTRVSIALLFMKNAQVGNAYTCTRLM